jgi:hypothetical protein
LVYLDDCHDGVVGTVEELQRETSKEDPDGVHGSTAFGRVDFLWDEPVFRDTAFLLDKRRGQ